MVVDSPADDGVYLDRPESRPFRRLDSLQNTLGAEVASVHLPENFVIQRVQANGNSLEARVRQLLGELRQEVSVGGHGQVFDAGNLGEHRHQLIDFGAYQGFTAGYSRLDDAHLHQNTCQPRYLLESQKRVSWQELVALPVYLSGHTVGTTEVAPVRHGDAEVSQRSSEPIKGCAREYVLFL